MHQTCCRRQILSHRRISGLQIPVFALQVANEARWNPKTSLTLRTQSTAWLWLSPSTLSQALGHTNALLREFSLGGEPAAASALQLLASLPAESMTLLEGEVAVSQLPDYKSVRRIEEV